MGNCLAFSGGSVMHDFAGNGMFFGVCRIRSGEKDPGDVCGGYDFREINCDVHGD